MVTNVAEMPWTTVSLPTHLWTELLAVLADREIEAGTVAQVVDLPAVRLYRVISDQVLMPPLEGS